MISKIPPLTQAETVKYYATGELPSRLADSAEYHRREILSHFGAKPPWGDGEGPEEKRQDSTIDFYRK